MAAMAHSLPTSVYLDRIARARAVMEEEGVDALLVSVGSDLPYLAGYEAMPLERLTMLVVPRDSEATLVIPRLEAPRVVEQPGVFGLLPWDETQDPVALVAGLLPRPGVAAVGDTMWARFLVDLLGHWPSGTTRYVRSNDVMSPLRARKDAAEITALQAAGLAADRVAAQLQSGQIPLAGRTEAELSADLAARLLAEGHDEVNFAIVAAGSNAASPHHHPGSRVIREGEIVLCDFGGTMNGYCSDITRCVFLGTPPADVADAYAVLRAAEAAGVAAGVVGAACQDVDRARRARSSPTPATASTSSTAPVTASAWRNTKTRTWWRATPPSSPLVMRSAWSRASMWPASGACAWRTSSSPRSPARSP